MLKVIACLTMLIDHVGYTFFPQHLWLRAIGRIAFPLFAWYVARGFARTRNRGRYLSRLVVWGLLSQLPFALLFHGASFARPASFLEGTNVLFTFAFALGGLWLIEACRGRHWSLQALSWAGYAAFGMAAELARTDYGFYGVLMVLLCHAFGLKRAAGTTGMVTAGVDGAPAGKASLPENRWTMWNLLLPGSILALTFAFVARGQMHPVQLLCAAAIPLLWLRLPDPAPGRWKYAFYAFYPLHILALYAIVVLLHGM